MCKNLSFKECELAILRASIDSSEKMQGEKQMVKWKARLRVKASFEVKSKVMKGKVGSCRVLRPDDWIIIRACGGCVAVGLGWV